MTIAETIRAGAANARAAGYQPWSTGPWDEVINDWGGRVAAALRSDEELTGLDGCHYRLASSAGPIRFEMAGAEFIKRALSGIEPSAIVDSMREITRSGCCELVVVWALRNIEVEREFQVAPLMTLLPATRLEANGARDMLFEPPPPYLGPNQLRPPASAICYRNPNYAAIVRSPMPEPQDLRIEPGPVNEQLEHVLAGLTVGAFAAPERSGSYFYVANVGWPAVISTGVSWYARRAPRIPTVTAATAFPVAEAIRLFQRRADPILSLAIAKLQSAVGRADPVERFIDLGTCIEIILLHGSESSGEIAHKISQRAAWLIGATAEERHDIARLMKLAYTLRSKAVHSGEWTPKSARLAEALGENEVERLCSNLILHIAEHGWPDWSHVTLGRPET